MRTIQINEDQEFAVRRGMGVIHIPVPITRPKEGERILLIRSNREYTVEVVARQYDRERLRWLAVCQSVLAVHHGVEI